MIRSQLQPGCAAFTNPALLTVSDKLKQQITNSLSQVQKVDIDGAKRNGNMAEARAVRSLNN